ncbi:MAG: UDP-N-acetylglucosamine 1-carboxyvinyltransferase [Candidatus Cloacimonetes bacterium]|nr:UDP-N-acetylglucosamine 1-carboxyvinyltransferase [Candidatus Cloacimonadota bacterium]
MDKFLIEGGRPLNGVVTVSGSKNSCLPILAATLLVEGQIRLENVPDLMDVRTMKRVLETLGAKVEFLREQNIMTVDASTVNSVVAPYELVKTMRASFLVMGPLLARFGRAEVSLPGGCSIGPRPVDYHLKAFSEMGATVDIGHGNIIAEGKLKGGIVHLDFPSVGATENIMMAASLIDGAVTVIENAAREPEIVDLANFMNACGARVTGAGTARVEIHGVLSLRPSPYRVMPDRIEAGTLILLSCITRSPLMIQQAPLEHLGALLEKLRECGNVIRNQKDLILVEPVERPRGVQIATRPHPGFPTDLQAPMMSYLATAEGVSVISEGVYENRFLHIPELCRMGAKIILDGHQAQITGVPRLLGAPVMAGDLRAGAALVLAALSAKGNSEIQRVYHIDRGYERLEQKLIHLGAQIQRMQG